MFVSKMSANFKMDIQVVGQNIRDSLQYDDS